MIQTVTIAYEGQSTVVVLKACDHCGKVPTEEDARKAVALDRSNCKACVVCGGKKKLPDKNGLYHSVDCSGKGGFILVGTGDPVDYDPNLNSDWVGLNGFGHGGMLVDSHAHIACLKKVLPLAFDR